MGNKSREREGKLKAAAMTKKSLQTKEIRFHLRPFHQKKQTSLAWKCCSQHCWLALFSMPESSTFLLGPSVETESRWQGHSAGYLSTNTIKSLLLLTPKKRYSVAYQPPAGDDFQAYKERYNTGHKQSSNDFYWVVFNTLLGDKIAQFSKPLLRGCGYLFLVKKSLELYLDWNKIYTV